MQKVVTNEPVHRAREAPQPGPPGADSGGRRGCRDPADGGGQGRGPMTAPPCLNCPDRRIGCHDPAVCPKWAAYDEIHRAELAAMPSRKEWVDMVEYIHDRRRRYMPDRWKKGDKSC